MILNPYRFGTSGGDPFWDDVVSLLHFDDSGDPWKDEKGVIWTPNGSPVLDTTNKKFGASSLGLDGSSHLSASDAGFAFGTGDFTIEFQVLNGGNSNRGIASNLFSGTHTGAVGVAIQSSTQAFLQRNDTSSTISFTWGSGFTHVAIARSGSSLRFFFNGIGSTFTDTRNLTSNNFYLGGYYSTAFRMLGNIDEVRITKGVARYTSSFTPPSAPFPNF